MTENFDNIFDGTGINPPTEKQWEYCLVIAGTLDIAMPKYDRDEVSLFITNNEEDFKQQYRENSRIACDEEWLDLIGWHHW